ncbi:MAG: hypothetical protein P0Y52_09290 [Candidatus Brevundimonas phytovorans]|nr:hypothetical protein [Brevundimonas sp.]WEK56743.1 MAG: hypothetical protein P0Y52_09290 [Brevundimonas sp.]
MTNDANRFACGAIYGLGLLLLTVALWGSMNVIAEHQAHRYASAPFASSVEGVVYQVRQAR